MTTSDRKRYRTRLLVAILSLTLLRGLIYSAVVPPWQAPDEPRHFEYVRLLDEKRRLVGWEDLNPELEREIIASMLRFDYWRFGFTDTYIRPPEKIPQRFWEIWRKEGTSHMLHQPPLAYLLYLLPLQFTRDAAPAIQLYAMRLLSVLLAALVILVAFWTLDILFPQDDVRLTASLVFIAFLPMHTYMTSMVNNDHLAELVTSMAILVWVLIFRMGMSSSRLLLLTVLIIVGALTKRTTLVLIPASLVAVALYLWAPERRPQFSTRRLAITGLMAGVILLLFAGILVAWGQIAAQHTPIVRTGVDFLLHYYLFLPSDRFSFSLNQPYFSRQALETYAYYAQLMFQTFWARFGWLNVVLAEIWYQTLAVVTLTAVVGLGVAAYRAVRGATPFHRWQWQALLFFGTCFLFALLLIVGREIRTEWRQTRLVGWPQGRYLFPVIIPIAVLYVVGWTALIPQRYHKAWLWLWTLGLIGFDALALLRYVVPFYHPG